MNRDSFLDLETVARHVGPRGEVVLRRRAVADGTVDELIVNGAFAMDSTETLSERALGDTAVAAVAGRSQPARILVGGLGLGYTVRQILDGADRDRLDVAVEVVEIESCLVDWARSGLTATLGGVAADPRVRLHVADVNAVLSAPLDDPAGPWDAIVLDVDNGPDFLIHGFNETLYGATGLRAAYGQLGIGGTLAIWCQGTAVELFEQLRRLGPATGESRYLVMRGERQFDYVIYTARRA